MRLYQGRAAGTKEFIDEYKSKSDRLARDKNVTKTMSLLPEWSQMVVLVNPQGLLEGSGVAVYVRDQAPHLAAAHARECHTA